MRGIWGGLAVVLAIGCSGGGQDVRARECAEFSDWNNGIGTEVGRRVPDLTGEATNEEHASFSRARANAIREIVARAIPFTDEGVRGYAQRIVATYTAQAAALDEESAAWTANDQAAVIAAQRRDVDSQAPRAAVLDEWASQCH